MGRCSDGNGRIFMDKRIQWCHVTGKQVYDVTWFNFQPIRATNSN
jgi:hypothetical protein